MNKKNSISTKTLAEIGILISIVIILSFTPLGFIPIGPIYATTVHIPVIISGILLGPFSGAVVGLSFGIMSMLKAIITPNVLSFINLNPIVSVLPRILIGVSAGIFYKKLCKVEIKKLKVILSVFFVVVFSILAISIYNNYLKGNSILGFLILILLMIILMGFTFKANNSSDMSVVISSGIASLVNTFFYLGFAYLFYAVEAAKAFSVTPDKALTGIMMVGVVNGAPEMIVAILLTQAIVKVAKKTRS